MSYTTIAHFNEHLKPTMTEIELLRLFSLAEEFRCGGGGGGGVGNAWLLLVHGETGQDQLQLRLCSLAEEFRCGE